MQQGPGATFVKLTKIWAWQELVFVLAAISKIEIREKALIFSYSDGLMTMYNGYALLCVLEDLIAHDMFATSRGYTT